MKQVKVLLLISCLFIIPLCGAANAAELKLADIALPCAQYGAPAVMPITLVNTVGATPNIAGVSTDITFDDSYLEFVGATIGPAGSAVGKTVTFNLLSPGVARVGVVTENNTTPIGDGVVAYVNFTIKKNPVGGADLTNLCSASDSAGNALGISCVSGGFFTAKTADFNLDGVTVLNEIIMEVRMFLGLDPVDVLGDPTGDNKVSIDDLIKAINCFLETKECACPTADVVPQEELWKESGHADTTAMAFNDWNDAGSIPASCAKCHSTPGYKDYLGADGSAAGVIDQAAPIGTVISCQACHNQQATELTSVVLESTGDAAAVPPIEKITLTGLGPEARCMVCHQGRASTDSVNAYIAGRATLAGDPDAVDSGASFRNIHYFAAAATLYGSQARGGYQYAGKVYDAKFAHIEGYDTCVKCHDPHSLELKYDKCVTCHTGATDKAALKNIRMKGSLVDYDGDGNLTEGLYYEVDGIRTKLYAAIQAYATNVAGTAIAYNPASHPYWFIDANANGVADPDETTAYNAYTTRLLQATYNYQVSVKDPGAFAHNGKYIIELLYDSIEDLNIKLATLVPSLAVDVSLCNRVDEGHFNGSSEAFRHWDEDPGVSGSCAKCHSGKGSPFFLTNNVNIQEPQANGMLCLNCHESVTDTVAPRLAVGDVTFPSGLKANLGDDSNLCMLCHQGRASKKTIDDKIAAGPAPYSFSNVHYYAAAASLFGTAVKGGYEYDGNTYAGQNPFSSHGGKFNTCVECHMGTQSLNADYRSHRVTKPNPNNCVCHAGDAPQTPGSFKFSNIRPASGFGSTDFDGDGNVSESIKNEIIGLEQPLYAQIQAYAAGTLGKPILYDPDTNPYWFKDTNGNGVADPGEIASSNSYGTNFDAKLLEAAYNYHFSKKESHGYIHNALYVAQLLVDSIGDLGGSTAPYTWR